VVDLSTKYRNSMGVQLTKALFWEMVEDKRYCLYTLKTRDHQNCLSLYRLYMDMDDITEYRFANTYFEGFEHWESIAAAHWMKEHVSQWRKELELRMKSNALYRMREMADSSSKEAFSANKYLLDKGWKDKDSTRGRPSKEEIKSEATRIAIEQSTFDEDLQRMTNITVQ
jgi:hypothetical protein